MVILYGAGGYGHSALNVFQENGCLDMVSYIIDNNPGLKGASLFGKPIYPYSDICDKLTEDCTIVITLELETAIKVADSLKKDGVIRYLYWAYEQYIQFDQFIEVLQKKNDYEVYSHTLKQELLTAERQRDYLLSHCDPHTIKPATGQLRKRQLALVELAKETVSMANEIGAHPFISWGNLLGYVRHNGFIPWDDDFDLSVLRKEYNCLKEYLIKRFYYSEYNGPLNDDRAQLIWIREELDKRPGEIVILERPMLFRVCKKTSDGDYLLIDFFPVDEFKMSASLEERLRVLQANKYFLNKATNVEEYKEAIKKIDTDDSVFREDGGGKISFGYDVRESYDKPKYSCYVLREEVFPLKTVLFEGESFEIPCNPEAFLRYEYGEDYMQLPKFVGLHFSSTDIEKQ